MFRKTTAVAAVLGMAFLIGGALPSIADARSECKERIRKAEYNLKREIERNGERGKEVDRRRRELERERQRCRMYEKEREDTPPSGNSRVTVH